MSASPLTVAAVVRIEPRPGSAFVPPLSDYCQASAGWVETEFTCLQTPAHSARVAFWSGGPCSVVLDPWPYTEVCAILSGRVAVADTAGGQVEFAAGDAFIIPKGFEGTWTTRTASTKVVVTIE